PEQWMPLGRRCAQTPEHNEVCGEHQQQAPNHRTLTEAGRLPAKLEQTAALGAGTVDAPGGPPETEECVCRPALGVPLAACQPDSACRCAARSWSVFRSRSTALWRSSQCVANQAPASNSG